MLSLYKDCIFVLIVVGVVYCHREVLDAKLEGEDRRQDEILSANDLKSFQPLFTFDDASLWSGNIHDVIQNNGKTTDHDDNIHIESSKEKRSHQRKNEFLNQNNKIKLETKEHKVVKREIVRPTSDKSQYEEHTLHNIQRPQTLKQSRTSNDNNNQNARTKLQALINPHNNKGIFAVLKRIQNVSTAEGSNLIKLKSIYNNILQESKARNQKVIRNVEGLSISTILEALKHLFMDIPYELTIEVPSLPQPRHIAGITALGSLALGALIASPLNGPLRRLDDPGIVGWLKSLVFWNNDDEKEDVQTSYEPEPYSYLHSNNIESRTPYPKRSHLTVYFNDDGYKSYQYRQPRIPSNFHNNNKQNYYRQNYYSTHQNQYYPFPHFRRHSVTRRTTKRHAEMDETKREFYDRRRDERENI